MITTIGASALVAGMMAINDDMRKRIVDVLAGDPSSQFATVTVQAKRSMQLTSSTLSDYAAGHEPLMLFGLVATVLLLLMLRS